MYQSEILKEPMQLENNTRMANLARGDMIALYFEDEVYKIPVLDSYIDDEERYFVLGKLDDESDEPTATPSPYRWYWNTSLQNLVSECGKKCLPSGILKLEIEHEYALEYAAMYERRLHATH